MRNRSVENLSAAPTAAPAAKGGKRAALAALSLGPKSALEEPIARNTGQRICGALLASDALGIVAVIESASQFYHHLRRVAPPMEMQSNCEIHMELHALVDTHGDGVLSPAGPNLLARGGATTSFAPDPMCPMGMTLRNESSRSWYPSVFYFDPSDFTILQWYAPALGTRTACTYHPLDALQSPAPRNRTRALQIDAPLPPHGALAIGYGNSGAQPWSFEVRDGEEVEVGFIKVFLTQRPADLSRIAQESVFARKGGEGMRLGAGRESVPEWMMSEWRTKVEAIPSVEGYESAQIPRVCNVRVVIGLCPPNDWDYWEAAATGRAELWALGDGFGAQKYC
ncbi:hypothetical protein K438DRAFT_1967480 [Mycena galopus ATCC 62051]|nr:hypothetical protein K438DRAFT_1967480 [Mycena galopus ATCC 62051]